MAMSDEEYIQRLHAVGIDLVNALQNRLTWASGRFTGQLSSSITYTIVESGLQITMEDYGEFIEFGIPNPTTASEILNWVQQKVIPKLKKKPKSPKAVLGIAKNIARHISLFGPRPTRFIKLTMDNDLPNILQKNGL